VVTQTRRAAEHEPIARVLPMLSVPHLDREFDYLVAADQSDDAQPGVRVRVRFHGRLVDAFVLERRSDTDHSGKLGWLDRVISAEPVLTPDIRRLADAVAARYVGTRPDVLRLAIPPRHAGVEKKPQPELAPLTPQPVDESGWARYGRGEQFLAAIREGRAARAVWQALPGEHWALRLAEAAAATVHAGRGALIVVPDQRDVDAVHAAAVGCVDESRVVALSAGLGPSQRYRRWLAVLRGQARLVIGTRSAVFAPIADLGLVVVWDDGDDNLAEPRAPYPHAVRWPCCGRTNCVVPQSSAGTPEPPRRTPWCAVGGPTISSRPGRWCVPTHHGWWPWTTTLSTRNATRRPTPPDCRRWRCAPPALRWRPGTRCWCRCRGAATCRHLPAPAAAPWRGVDTAPGRCRCRTGTPRARCAAGAPAPSCRCVV